MDIEPSEKQGINTMTTNSPGSVKSMSEGISCPEAYPLSLEPSLDNSLEFGSQANHAANIFDASVDLYNNSVSSTVISQNGFNNENIYSSSCFKTNPQTVDEAIKANRMLRYCQKVNFIEELQQESELSHLLVEMMLLFNQKIFGELIFVIHTIWNKRYLNFREGKNTNQNILPKFNCFLGFEGGELEK